MKRAVIAAAQRKIVLADSSKFGPPSFCTICDLDDVDELVTDEAVPETTLALLRVKNVKIRVVSVAPSASQA